MCDNCGRAKRKQPHRLVGRRRLVRRQRNHRNSSRRGHRASQTQPAWPTQAQQPQTSNQNPYGVQREPNPYPGPYSAEVPTSRDY